MVCKNCGANFEGNFCSSCGASVQQTPPAQAPYGAQSQGQRPYRAQQQPRNGYEDYDTAPQKPKKKGGCLKIGLIVVGVVVVLFVIIMIIAIASGDGTSTATNSSSQTGSVPSEAQTPAAANTIRVGETTELNGVEVTFLSVSESTGNEIIAPEAGNTFILFELEIVNNTDEEINVSSVISFEGYCDDYVMNFSLNATVANDMQQFDGTIAPGKRMKGAVAYEIPQEWSTMEVLFAPDVWGEGKITFIAEK